MPPSHLHILYPTDKMGLNLECGDVDIRVGRYGTYHELKVAFIKMAINYIADDPQLVEKLQKMIAGNQFNIQYFAETPEIKKDLAAYGLGGLCVWLTHSDCSGAIDSINAEDFYDFLQLTMRPALEAPVAGDSGIIINNFMPDDIRQRMEQMNDEELVDEFYITPVFKESARTGEDVFFC